MSDGATCACHLVRMASSCLTSPDAAAESDWSRKLIGSSAPSSVVEGIAKFCLAMDTASFHGSRSILSLDFSDF